MRTYLQILIYSLFFCMSSANAQNINVLPIGGGTTFQTPKVKKAGDDFKNNKAKKRLKAKIKISFPNQFSQYYQYWTVEIRREDIHWHNKLSLWARRKNNNAGVYYGSYFRKIHTCDDFFFNGYGSNNNIQIEFELRGLSVLIPADEYETEVVFTIMDY